MVTASVEPITLSAVESAKPTIRSRSEIKTGRSSLFHGLPFMTWTSHVGSTSDPPKCAVIKDLDALARGKRAILLADLQ